VRGPGRGVWLIAAAAALVAGCAPQPPYTPTPTRTPVPASAAVVSTAPMPTPTVTPSPPPTAPPTATPDLTAEGPSPAPTEPSPTPAEAGPQPTAGGSGGEAAPAEPPPEAAEGLPGHFWLGRPIPADYRDWLDRTYPYGGTSGGRLRPHTGGDFFNPEGTPVIAASDGTVYYAGTDAETLYGPDPNFYGNLIVLRTNLSYQGQPVYTLYGHLSQIGVEPGQNIAAGEEIGRVGGTGVANGGAHLHFEVRVGDPTSYVTSTRNPDLWIAPYGGYGTLAGRVADAGGAALPNVSVTIRGEDAIRYAVTYAGAENIPDAELGENFTYGDLPAGWYTVTTGIQGRSVQQRVYVPAGQIAWVVFNLE
jgi:murein DD-endopeptidase MepM/ murein hydrolase activator NlpD